MIKMNGFQITNIRRINKGALLHIFDVCIGSVTIKEFRLIRSKSGSIFVGFPQRNYKKDGETRWVSLVEMDQKELKSVTQMAINACGLNSSPAKSERSHITDPSARQAKGNYHPPDDNIDAHRSYLEPDDSIPF